MSKSNDTSKLDHAKLENRVLADSELDAVTGGRLLEAATKGKSSSTLKYTALHGVEPVWPHQRLDDPRWFDGERS